MALVSSVIRLRGERHSILYKMGELAEAERLLASAVAGGDGGVPGALALVAGMEEALRSSAAELLPTILSLVKIAHQSTEGREAFAQALLRMAGLGNAKELFTVMVDLMTRADTAYVAKVAMLPMVPAVVNRLDSAKRDKFAARLYPALLSGLQSNDGSDDDSVDEAEAEVEYEYADLEAVTCMAEDIAANVHRELQRPKLVMSDAESSFTRWTAAYISHIIARYFAVARSYKPAWMLGEDSSTAEVMKNDPLHTMSLRLLSCMNLCGWCIPDLLLEVVRDPRHHTRSIVDPANEDVAVFSRLGSRLVLYLAECHYEVYLDDKGLEYPPMSLLSVAPLTRLMSACPHIHQLCQHHHTEVQRKGQYLFQRLVDLCREPFDLLDLETVKVDPLQVLQCTLTAMTRVGDPKEREQYFRSIMVFVRAFDNGSRLLLFKKLLIECPYSNAAAALVDEYRKILGETWPKKVETVVDPLLLESPKFLRHCLRSAVFRPDVDLLKGPDFAMSLLNLCRFICLREKQVPVVGLATPRGRKWMNDKFIKYMKDRLKLHHNDIDKKMKALDGVEAETALPQVEMLRGQDTQVTLMEQIADMCEIP